MSKRTYINSKVVRISNVVFRLCIVLSFVLLSLAIQTTNVYAFPADGDALTKMVLEPHAYISSVVVQVYDTDGTPKSGVNVYAFSGTAYSGVSGVSNSYGTVTLTLPDGDYRFRADLNGTKFWSGTENTCSIPTCTTDIVTVSKPVSVTVVDTDGTPKAGLSVYAFDGTTYSGHSKVSDEYGVATFILPSGDYHFRADLYGTQFWSAETNDCSIPGCENVQITVSKPVTVTVMDTDGTPISGLNIYAFDGTTYSGYNKVSNAYGAATFILPLGDYRFRADLNGTKFWSAGTNHCTLPGCESAHVTVSKPLAVTVVDTDGTIQAGLNVYAFDGNTYAGYSKVTDATGVATFTLPLGEYRFRADLNGTRFWSADTNHCTLPGCESAQVTVSKPVTVTVLDSGGTPKTGLNVYAFDGTTYSGYSKATNVNGEATFTLPIGDYRFRADFNGTQFWSDSINHCTIPDCTDASVIVTQPVTVTVMDTNGAPQYGLNVYAFDGSVYKNYSKTTNLNGEAVFTLPQGDYRFRADLNGTQFWSSTSNDCSVPGCSTSSVTVTIPAQVVVQDTLGEAITDVPVYAFNGTTYANYSKRTNEDGIAILTLPQGDYRFRVDVDGEQIWSGSVNHCTIPGCELVNVVLEAEATLTPTITNTMTVTPTPTATMTITPTVTRTMTITSTRTNTPSFTPSATRTRTPTHTKTSTRTRTLTQTYTRTRTRTLTQTYTGTIMLAPTQTQTPTSTITETPTLTPTQASCAGTGSILRQSWDSISSGSISALQTDPRYPYFPDDEDYILRYKGPVNYGDYYGARYRGYICAPYDDWYRFYVSSDQNSEFYLSTSTDPAGMAKIAYVSGWTSDEDWDRYSSQRSEWIYLNAGQEYYTESYHVEGAGPDNFTVGWEGLNHFSGDIQVIDGDYLRPYIPEVVPTPQTCANVGSILRQRFSNISGYGISSLTSASKYPNNADYWEYHTDFDIPPDYPNEDNYGERWRGYVCPPYDGDYTFYVAADDASQLYLSTDTDSANMSLIAYNNSWTPYQDYYRYSSQASATQHLLGGTLYYVEALFKEGTASDSFTVAWDVPYYSGPYAIQGEYLVPITPEPTYTPTITLTPTTTLTPTITLTPTETYPATITYTPSNTPTITRTPTITQTLTITQTPTRTFTPSRTKTWTSTPTRTITRTPTCTFTPTRTYTPSMTYTQTATGTPTEYKSPTPTNTITIFGGG